MLGVGTKEKKDKPIFPGFRMKGDTIAGRYRVERLLGSGSSGFVVAARHVYLRRPITLKILTSTTHAHGQAQRRCLAAAHHAATLRGPHIARIVDTGFTEDGMPFIATERLEGRTLADELAERTQLPATEAVRWMLQACDGLAEAHAAGIVHGDLKPQNLFLAGTGGESDPDDATGAARTLKILDFGMATPLDEEGDEGSSTWFASPAYLAPEQIRDPHSVDGRADVWALGVTLHQLIAGSLPFTADTVSGMLIAVAYDEPAMLASADVPFELARVVQSCLAKDPAARPADMAALARALAPFSGKARNAAHSLPPVTVSLGDDATPPVKTAPPPLPSKSKSKRRKPPPLPPKAKAAAPVASPPVASPPAGAPKVDAAPVIDAPPVLSNRRRGAMLLMATAAAFAVVRLVASPETKPETLDSKSQAAPPPPRHGGSSDEERAPMPFIPPSFAPTREPASAPRDSGATAPPPPPRAAPPAARAVSMPAARAVAKDLPSQKPRGSLAVREDPYTRGFTHPTRLSERRK